MSKPALRDRQRADAPLAPQARVLAREDDFFVDWDADSNTFLQKRLRDDLLRQIINGPLPGVPEIELCDVLVQLTRTEFTAYGMGMKQRITDADSRLLVRACRAAGVEVKMAIAQLRNGLRDCVQSGLQPLQWQD